jgi:hypothetical protein
MSAEVMTEKKVFVLLMLYILWCRQSERGLAKKQQQIPLQKGGGGVSVCAVLKLNTIYLVLTLGHLAKSKHCVKEAAPLYSSRGSGSSSLAASNSETASITL